MRKKFMAVAAVVLVVIAGGLWSSRLLFGDNRVAACANCSSFIHCSLDQYVEEHDGWYPRGGKTPLDSLSKCIKDAHEVHFFTSHKLDRQQTAYWEKTHSFAEEYSCYRYVEGLRNDDPDGLILLYYYEPTKWECMIRAHMKSEPGRPTLLKGETHLEFLTEAAFQQKLDETLQYLQAKGRLPHSAKQPADGRR